MMGQYWPRLNVSILKSIESAFGQESWKGQNYAICLHNRFIGLIKNIYYLTR
jgi:hypothetical protein